MFCEEDKLFGVTLTLFPPEEEAIRSVIVMEGLIDDILMFCKGGEVKEVTLFVAKEEAAVSVTVIKGIIEDTGASKGAAMDKRGLGEGGGGGEGHTMREADEGDGDTGGIREPAS